ncbi:DUF4012 domain-containing protein [Patescibacteria group bacterium]|nr:DUF4012 domain-containing protein [Patescibacteria group bacterium]
MINKPSSLNKSLVSKPTAFVAGGAGFVGSFVCQSLLFQGCRVVAIDNLSSGRKDNLSFCFDNPDFVFLNHDLTKPLPAHLRADYIFHLAGMEHRPNTSTSSLLVNSKGTEHLLQLAKKLNARFLLASAETLPVTKSDLFQKIQRRSTFKELSTARRFAEELVVSYLKDGLDGRIVRLSSLYGPRMDLDSTSEVSQVFSTFFGKKLAHGLPANRLTRPLYISDAVFGLMKAMFSAQMVNENLISFSGSDEISIFDFYHRVAKMSQAEPKVRFYELKNELIVGSKTSTESFSWEPKISLEEGIEKTASYFKKGIKSFTEPLDLLPAVSHRVAKVQVVNPVVQSKLEETKGTSPAVRRVKTPPLFARRQKKFAASFVLGLVIFVMVAGIPFYPLLLKMSVFGWQTWRSWRGFKEQDFSLWREKAELSYQASIMVEQETDRLSHLFSFFPAGEISLVRESWYWRQMAGLNFRLSCLAEEVDDRLAKDQFTSTGLQNNLDQIWWHLVEVELDLEESPDLPLTLSLVENKTGLKISSTQITQWRHLVYQAKSMAEHLDKILGLQSEATYLVLLQNNMELRPTGGFIGSFGLVPFKEGDLGEIEIYDVYDADGQLKGHIDPPSPIREHLGEASWYLRDSNWDPNFPTSAMRSMWFLEKSLGIHVDGVVALNFSMIRDVVAQLGEIELVDYQQTVTADNLFLLTQQQAEEDFFPGSKNKKSFLADLTQAIMSRLKEGDLSVYRACFQSVLTSLEKKDLQVYFSDSQLQEVVAGFNWDGSLRTPRCLFGERCFADYLMIVEANLGVNKANYYLEREIDFGVEVGETEVIHELRLNYQNKSLETDLYGGAYKNYLRLYVPLGSRLKKVVLDGVEVDLEEVDEEISNGKAVFGLFVIIPPQAEIEVEVTWDQRRPADLEEYLLYVQRQPGADESLTRIEVNPLVEATVSATFGIEKIEDRLQTERVFNTDLLIGFEVRSEV